MNTSMLMNILLSLMAVMLVLQTTHAAPASSKGMLANIPVCINNCAQCHDIIGDVFDHRKCSRDCIKKQGSFFPDCTNGKSIQEYLQLKTFE